MPYSVRFKQKMIEKLTGPGAMSATALSKEVSVSQATLSRWLRDAKLGSMPKSKKPSKGRRRRWSAADKVRLVREAAALDEAELGAFLRREGLHQADLDRFSEEVDQAATEALAKKGRRRGPSPEEKEIRRLRKELDRKDKALAEAAALLVLRGKVQAFLSAEEEGDTDGKSEK
jgi:transposase-like protein